MRPKHSNKSHIQS